MPTVEVEIQPSVLTRLLALVKAHTGITMEERKGAMLGTRLRKRMRVLGLTSYAAYADFLDANRAEVQEFVNLVTTNETFFFRTPAVWRFFRTQFLPDWKARAEGRPLRLWSAAASAGAEAYSLAVSCEEAGVDYRILATDISTAVLDEAREGRYEGRIAEDLRTREPLLTAKYFERRGDALFVQPRLKTSVEFAPHNLFRGPARRVHFDFVFLRNVLIYFHDRDQELVLGHVAEALLPGGYLALGESESLSRLNTEFRFHEPLIYRKGEQA